MANRRVPVMDFVIADGTYYKPAIIRSYTRFTYMPNGESLLKYLTDTEEEMRRIEIRLGALEDNAVELINLNQTLRNMVERVSEENELLRRRVAALEAK